MDSNDPHLPNHAAQMLATSRIYLGLAARRRTFGRGRVLLRWLRMVLLAGGLGSLTGTAVLADTTTGSARAPDEESLPLASIERETRRSLERMP